jgi:two-component system repressor protein LuxO
MKHAHFAADPAVPEAATALMLMDATPFDVIVSDIRMPGMDGTPPLKMICETYPARVRSPGDD